MPVSLSLQDLCSFDTFVIDDEESTCRLDGRLDFERIASANVVFPVIRTRADLIGETYRRWLGLEESSNGVSLIGGGLAQFWSAVQFLSKDSDHGEELRSPLRALVHSEVAHGRDVLSPFIGTRDLETFSTVSGVTAATERADDHHFLVVDDAQTTTELVSRLPRRARKTWARDLRDAARLGLSSEASPLTLSNCLEASISLADTSRRNGDSVLPLIAEWRLATYLRRPGVQHLIRVLREGAPVAYIGARLSGDLLDIHSFGIETDTEHSREIYQHMFAAAVELALAEGARLIHFGTGHDQSKTWRGCVAVPRWRVRYFSR